ncbi:NADPH-dependent FMN reductase [Amycolatopsis acidicola]|uniref:NADPH-dependent FMN reductase n=1 Tax=Amycolatopsis acidicola TaxID=2596893 RepID=A0A5N0V9Y1_9PSEU|nr:FMN reductase [Amycolatopsis acidicola]KAA9162073.1 NADPH-dependent FMN reductase [Amycolatopsis acidicola]
MSEFTIVALSAGLNQPSSTRLLADRLTGAAVSALEAGGATVKTETIELRDIAHDVVNTMLTGFPAGKMPAVFDAVTSASGLIAVTPVFTTSYSGLFKSFVDVLDNEALTGMPVLLGATGGTARHSLALDYNLRPVFTYLHADVVTTGVFAATDDWASGEDSLPGRIERAGGELAAKILGSHRAGPVDDYASVPSFEELLGR